MADLDQLISHRFRGFAQYENSIEGLINALDYGVKQVEFDIRVTRCGTPIIYHDESAKSHSGQDVHIADLLYSEFKSIGGAFSIMPTADALFKAAARHANKAKLLIDIKDYGFEVEIDALIRSHRLQKRVTYVSWLPEVIFRMHDIATDIPLCLSHWCKSPDDNTRRLHIIHEAQDGQIPRTTQCHIHGKRSGWYVSNGLKGELLDILKSSSGSICVPEYMITKDLSAYYHAHGIKVSTFSYLDWDHINTHESDFQIDTYFIDNKRIFEAFKVNP